MSNQKIAAILSKFRERRSAVGEEYAVSKGLEDLLIYLKDVNMLAQDEEQIDSVNQTTAIKPQSEQVINITKVIEDEKPETDSKKARSRKW